MNLDLKPPQELLFILSCNLCRAEKANNHSVSKMHVRGKGYLTLHFIGRARSDPRHQPQAPAGISAAEPPKGLDHPDQVAQGEPQNTFNAEFSQLEMTVKATEILRSAGYRKMEIRKEDGQRRAVRRR